MSYAQLTDRERELAKRAAAKLMAAQPPPEPPPVPAKKPPRHVFFKDGKYAVRFGRGGRIVNVGTFATVEAATIAVARFLAAEKKEWPI